MSDRQLIEDLLSALEYHTEQTRPIEFSKVAIQAAREYLRKPAQQQEPVAWMWKDGTITSDPDRADGTWMPLYTPPQAQPAQQQEPLFWYRPCSNGMYEGPIHNAQIERIRKESGAWHPLYTSPPAQQAQTSKPLTDEEIWKFWWGRPEVPEGEDDSMEAQFIAAVRAIEAAQNHGIKENT